MDNKTFYYARVSSREQNLNRQIEAFKKLGAVEREIICDKKSGKNLDRTYPINNATTTHTHINSSDIADAMEDVYNAYTSLLSK